MMIVAAMKTAWRWMRRNWDLVAGIGIPLAIGVLVAALAFYFPPLLILAAAITIKGTIPLAFLTQLSVPAAVATLGAIAANVGLLFSCGVALAVAAFNRMKECFFSKRNHLKPQEAEVDPQAMLKETENQLNKNIYDELRANLSDAQEEIKELNGELQELKGKLQELNEKLQESERENAALKESQKSKPVRLEDGKQHLLWKTEKVKSQQIKNDKPDELLPQTVFYKSSLGNSSV